MTGPAIAVYGATGHTGRLVAADLIARGHENIVLAGRDDAALRAVRDRLDAQVQTRVASLDEPASLRELLDGVSVVINCAGPFSRSGAPIASAAIAAGSHYVGHAAEPQPIKELFDTMQGEAADTGTVIIPGMSFYGAVADLLASVVSDGLPHVEKVTVAYAVRGWRMTAASKNTALGLATSDRLVFADGSFATVPNVRSTATFAFPAPVGRRSVLIDYPAGEVVTIPRHVPTSSVEALMTLDTFQDEAAFTSEHIDDTARAQSAFTVVVDVAADGETRRAYLHGDDIYGVGARISVEAALRLARSAPAVTGGVRSASEVFSAKEFLASLKDLAGFVSTSNRGRDS